MYIRKAEIKNIKGVLHFEMDFSPFSKAGWHVLIGDNGSGKTTILRAIALGLLNSRELYSLELDEQNYLGAKLKMKKGKGGTSRVVRKQSRDTLAFSKLYLELSNENDHIYGFSEAGAERDVEIDSSNKIVVDHLIGETSIVQNIVSEAWSTLINVQNEHKIEWAIGAIANGEYSGLFAVGYGPMRRISEGKKAPANLKAKAFWTLFSEEGTLIETDEWLKNLKLDSSTNKSSGKILEFLVGFINSSGLLPNGVQLTDKIDSKGIKIKDAEGNMIRFQEASDGYRSILSLAFDMIKTMIESYGIEKVMGSVNQNAINLPGVVLIDEIDAHLHPNWQVRVGKWFTDFFPEIQFIVTTHSPLICRGCGENGQIWHLKTPGSQEKSGPLSEIQRKRLVFGDVLDAYDTGVFGPHQSSAASVALRERLASLHMRSIKGVITEEERSELQDLQSFL